MKIETKRLVLRPLRKSDFKSIVRNVNDFEVSKWLAAVVYPYSRNDAIEWINHNKEKWKDKDRNDYSFGIELKEEKSIIGGIGVHKVDTYSGFAEVGYWLGRNYHKKGYGSEALEAIIDFAFKTLNLTRLQAGVFVGNPSSAKLLEKFGFVKEGLKLKSIRSKSDGELKDEYIYALLKENYRLITN